MEVIEIADSSAEVETQSTEQNRMLKRNIGDLAVDGKINQDFKSPARKGVKFCHDTILRRELEQWKQLITYKGILQSVTNGETPEFDPNDVNAMLVAEQRNFLQDKIDIKKWIEESQQFRRKCDYYLRVSKVVAGLKADRMNAALDVGRKQTAEYQTHFMHCERFCPL